MIDTKDMDLEECKDLLYDIRDGRVKAEDVIWHNTFENNSTTNIANPTIESARQSMIEYLDKYRVEDIVSSMTKEQRTWWNNCITFITTSIITGNSDDFIRSIVTKQ